MIKHILARSALLLIIGYFSSLAGAQTVSITHEEGTTEAPLDPQRVVVVGMAMLEMAWVLDLNVVGLAAGDEIDPAAKAIDPAFFAQSAFADSPYADITIVGNWVEPSLEGILALDPDLIIRQYWGQEDYAQLSAIAPTLSFDEPWRETLPEMAKLVSGGDTLAQAARSETDETFASMKQQLQDAEVFGRYPKALVLSPFPDGTVYLSTGDRRIAGIVQALGFEQELPPSLDDITSDSGVISEEAILQVPEDTVIFAIAYDTFEDKDRSMELMEGSAAQVVRYTLELMAPWTGPLSDRRVAAALTEEVLRTVNAQGTAP